MVTDETRNIAECVALRGRKDIKKGFTMKKVLILLVVLLAVPAIAASTVTIPCTDDGVDTVTVSYTTDANLIRGFGLDLTVDSGATITGVTVLDSNYRIYPGQIVIVDGNVTDYNTPYAPGSLGSASVAVELASLYTEDANYTDPNYGYNMKPGQSGTLLSFTVNRPGDCNYTIAENAASGGVVMEDPDEIPNVGTPLCTGLMTDCFPSGHADYGEWVTMSKPPSWCYTRQCRADADNSTELIGKSTYWVGLADLDIMVANWGDKAGITSALQADFSHSSELIGKSTYRVGLVDLDILIANWGDKLGTPPDCLDVP